MPVEERGFRVRAAAASDAEGRNWRDYGVHCISYADDQIRLECMTILKVRPSGWRA